MVLSQDVPMTGISRGESVKSLKCYWIKKQIEPFLIH